MPTTYTHYRFGKDVLSALPRPLQKAIEGNRELFDIGLHGPDIFFYYQFYHSNKVTRSGHDMHEQYGDEFFAHAAEQLETAADKAAVRAYLYGFICHFTLDSECHKYIEKMIQVSGLSHSEIEMEFDRKLLVQDYIDPMTCVLTKHIHPTRKNAEVIAPLFEQLSVDEVQAALKGMITCHKLLLAPKETKRKLLFSAMKLAGLYESNQGMVMSRQPNPDCAGYCDLLENRYSGAVPLAASLIGSYQKVLFEQAELPKRFHETFGPGEDWETLRL